MAWWRNSLWDELRRIQEEMDTLFEHFFSYEPFGRQRLLTGPSRDVAVSNYRQPLADVWETDKEIVATVELPGVNKEDIKINATEDGVEIKVEKKDEVKEEDKKKGMYRLERRYAGFYKYISLPQNVDVNNIDATYKNGVLELRIPKKEEQKAGREVKVK